MDPSEQSGLFAPPGAFSTVAAAALFSGLALIAALDAVTDVRLGLPTWNVAIDVVLTTAAVFAGAAYWRRSLRLRREATALARSLAVARADVERWRAEAAGVLPALGAAIQRQFQRWGLTPDEQHVALLLLNGLSARGIADVRHTHARVVRQQCFEIYRKAGISSRTALSAFFLQDLFFLVGRPVPRADQGTPAAAGNDATRCA